MRHRAAGLLAFLFVSVMTVACNKNSNQNASQPTVVAPPQVSPVKRYHLKGKVVSVDKQSKMLNMDGEAIPDFMDAMTMAYEVRPESAMDKLKPGDVISADVVLQDEKAWLENIVVTGRSAAAGKPQ
jgi:Cu/Ag efflux protein CusF